MYAKLKVRTITLWNYLRIVSQTLYQNLPSWRRAAPIECPEALRRFVEQRAKFIAQTTLYGYIKTRIGTRFTLMFEDELFVKSVNIAKWEVYIACLSDLTIHAAASVGRTTGATPEVTSALAIYIVEETLGTEEIPNERPKGFDDAREAFRIRARGTNWVEIDDSEGPFRRSTRALVEWAPIAPELKKFDGGIVINSMRFKWKHVRDELRGLLRSDEIMRKWQADDLPNASHQ